MSTMKGENVGHINFSLRTGAYFSPLAVVGFSGDLHHQVHEDPKS